MSQLVRFKIGNDKFFTKAIIYERHSRKQECAVCGQRRWGILVRHKEPKKIPDTLICLECITQISRRMIIELGEGDKFGKYNRKKIIQYAPRRSKKKGGPKPGFTKEKNKCPYCDTIIAPHGMSQHIKYKHPDAEIPEVEIPEVEISDAEKEENNGS